MTEKPQNLDNVLIEIKTVMRRANLLQCQKHAIASAKMVELDSLLANTYNNSKAFTVRQMWPVYIILAMQGIFDIWAIGGVLWH